MFLSFNLILNGDHAFTVIYYLCKCNYSKLKGFSVFSLGIVNNGMGNEYESIVTIFGNTIFPVSWTIITVSIWCRYINTIYET